MVKTESVVIKRKKLTNRLSHLTLYTKKFGKLNVLYRHSTKEFPMAIEVFSLSVFSIKFITHEKIEALNCKLLKHRFTQNLLKIKYFSFLSKSILNFTFSPDEKIFNLLNFYLDISEKYNLASAMFLVKLAYFEGLFPQLERCTLCKSERISFFSMENGGVLCKNCKDKREKLFLWNENMTNLTEELLKKPFDTLKTKAFEERAISNIRKIFKSHLLYRAGEYETFKK